jgi:hypothetical protein
MKLIKSMSLLSILSTGLLCFSGGCSTPAYSTQERFQMIGRNWTYEYEQSQDDIDHFFLLRPASNLTEWNVQ